jgi:hypothetical protein
MNTRMTVMMVLAGCLCSTAVGQVVLQMPAPPKERVITSAIAPAPAPVAIVPATGSAYAMATSQASGKLALSRYSYGRRGPSYTYGPMRQRYYYPQYYGSTWYGGWPFWWGGFGFSCSFNCHCH